MHVRQQLDSLVVVKHVLELFGAPPPVDYISKRYTKFFCQARRQKQNRLNRPDPAVNDHETFLAKDFVNDSIVALTKFEKPRKVAFQRLRFDVRNVLSQPSNAVYNAASDGGIESLRLPAGALQDSRSEHRLGQLQTAYRVFQEFSAFSLGHGSLLPQKPFAHTLPKHQTFVRVTEEFDEFLFDCQTDELFKFVGSHFSNDLRHNLRYRFPTSNNPNRFSSVSHLRSKPSVSQAS